MSGYFSDPDAAISHSVDTGEAVVYEPGSEVEAGLSAAEHSHPAYNVTVTLMKRRIGDVHSKLKKFENNPPTSVFRAAVMAALDEIAPVQDVPLMEGSVNLDRWQRLSGLLTERAGDSAWDIPDDMDWEARGDSFLMDPGELADLLDEYLENVTDDEFKRMHGKDTKYVTIERSGQGVIDYLINNRKWTMIGNRLKIDKEGFDEMGFVDGDGNLPADLGIQFTES
jgi:hypothetical protein